MSKSIVKPRHALLLFLSCADATPFVIKRQRRTAGQYLLPGILRYASTVRAGLLGDQNRINPDRHGSDHRTWKRVEVPLPVLQKRRG